MRCPRERPIQSPRPETSVPGQVSAGELIDPLEPRDLDHADNAAATSARLTRGAIGSPRPG
jgi:hypothetical protein